MRFVLDMNISPQWINPLSEAGHDAVHWSSIGESDAKDSEIMAWAAGHSRIVLTSDLDFSAILALTSSSKPSVVQLRTEATLPDRVGTLVMEAIAQAETDLAAGALLTIEARGARIRILPFDP